MNLQIESDSVVHCVITGNTYNFRSRMDSGRKICVAVCHNMKHFEIATIVIRIHLAFKEAGTIPMHLIVGTCAS